MTKSVFAGVTLPNVATDVATVVGTAGGITGGKVMGSRTLLQAIAGLILGGALLSAQAESPEASPSDAAPGQTPGQIQAAPAVFNGLSLRLDAGQGLRPNATPSPIAAASAAPASPYALPSPVLAQRPFAAAVDKAAALYKVDAALVHAVINTESAYNAHALSPKGAVGLMQLMPDTARRYGVKDPRKAESNILAGTAYLRDLLDMFHQDVNLAVAAYNAGENAVIRHGNQVPPYKETRAYVPKVVKLYRELAPVARNEVSSTGSGRIRQRFAAHAAIPDSATATN